MLRKTLLALLAVFLLLPTAVFAQNTHRALQMLVVSIERRGTAGTVNRARRSGAATKKSSASSLESIARPRNRPDSSR